MAQKAARSRAASHISRLPVSGQLCRLPVGLSGPLGHVGHHAPASTMSQRRVEQQWRKREVAHAEEQAEAWPTMER